MSNIDATRVMGSTLTMGGATMQMPSPVGGDAMRTQMGGTTTCPVCKSTTPLMEAYCGDCGFLLASAANEEELAIPKEETPAAELVDEATGRRYRLNPGINTVGRQGTDVLATEGTVSRNHATITVGDLGVTVEDLGSSNGTKVGDIRLKANEPTRAETGTQIRFGSWKLTLQVSAQSTVAPAEATIVTASPDRTVVLDGDSAVQIEAGPETVQEAEVAALLDVVAVLKKQDGPSGDLDLTLGTHGFGRKSGNAFVLPDPYLSGKHGEFVVDETGAYLTDLGSTNGTFVNGQRLAPNERQLLLDGDEVQLGQTKYLFESAPQSAVEAIEPSASVDDADGVD